MSRRKRNIGIALLVLLLLIIPPIGITFREFRQEQLDHALIEAIKAGDDKKALEALAEGANGEARDTGKSPTFREALLQLLDHFQHSHKQDFPIPKPALLLLFRQSDPVRGGAGPGLALAQGLLDHGANVNDQDEDGTTPLNYACDFSNPATVRLLLERGANTEATNLNGSTPLMSSNAKQTKILLNFGANIEAADKQKWTPLIYAVNNDEYDVICVLLEHGAKVSTKDASSKTAYDHLGNATPDFYKIDALLRQYGAK